MKLGLIFTSARFLPGSCLYRCFRRFRSNILDGLGFPIDTVSLPVSSTLAYFLFFGCTSQFFLAHSPFSEKKKVCDVDQEKLRTPFVTSPSAVHSTGVHVNLLEDEAIRGPDLLGIASFRCGFPGSYFPLSPVSLLRSSVGGPVNHKSSTPF